jgi:hypothetical protein
MEKIETPTGNHNIDFILSSENRTIDQNETGDVIRYLIDKHNKLAELLHNSNIQFKWINVSEAKPSRAYGMSSLSDKVEVKTEHGEGFGIYDYSEDNWLVELKADNTDELQSYTGVIQWRYK